MTELALDAVYMDVAKEMKQFSKDPERQVGACIVDPIKNVIVSTGSNHFPDGCDDKFGWFKAGGLDNKLLYVVHAEANAIIKRSSDIEGCVMYSTFYPCNNCAKLIVQSNIKKVFYSEDKRKIRKQQEGSGTLKAAGIDCIQI